jgi:hypothetical protein
MVYCDNCKHSITHPQSEYHTKCLNRNAFYYNQLVNTVTYVKCSWSERLIHTICLKCANNRICEEHDSNIKECSNFEEKKKMGNGERQNAN